MQLLIKTKLRALERCTLHTSAVNLRPLAIVYCSCIRLLMEDFKVPVLPAPLAKSDAAVAERPEKLNTDEKFTPAAATPSAACPYKIPKWSAPPAAHQSYKFEVLKSGQIIEEVKDLQQQATWTFGRLPDNDIEMAHPTISRFHAVLQYKPPPSSHDDTEQEENGDEASHKSEQPEGWYVYDLGSTHGTFLNKQRLPPRVFIRIRVGHMLKLGASTRAYILQGPSEDEEPESELTVTELREQREQQAVAAAEEKQRKALEAEERERNEGVSWGMGEDADEETDLTHNPYASTNNEELFFDDPKRTLRGFFEREGLYLEYKCDELAQGSFVCRVELPLDDSNGRPIVVEVTHKGRKKDCVVQCALEACRTLDRHGVLRQANQESQKRKIVKPEDSDDEDEFLDRTGDVARKKQRKVDAGTSVTLTYDDLIKKEAELNIELREVEVEITNYQENQKRLKALAAKQQNASDDLDNFMDTLSEDVEKLDKTEIKRLRVTQQRIKAEQLKLQRLIKIAKPTAMPFQVTGMETDSKAQGSLANKKQLPMIGKRNQFSKFKVIKALPSTRTKASTKAFASDEEEVEEEEEDEEDENEDKNEDETDENKKKEEEKEEDVSEVAAKPVAKKSSEPTALTETVTANVDIVTDAVAPVNVVASPDTEQEPILDDTPLDAPSVDAAAANTCAQSEEVAQQKKRRQRARQRIKQRPDVDMELGELAEHEDDDKYAKWVPPTNQSGDGITHLNEKFGY
ncbi:kanadaptin [Scaptodrosophila lebanonensis]|uniref:Kanadaptin n=1 Tax=Drosophila lebanonensis TaxID=7225 RepID=A0A6J2T910_DROLE|nr:kanadaptin [Scaptodrosophila lebanonensis]